MNRDTTRGAPDSRKTNDSDEARLPMKFGGYKCSGGLGGTGELIGDVALRWELHRARG